MKKAGRLLVFAGLVMMASSSHAQQRPPAAQPAQPTQPAATGEADAVDVIRRQYSDHFGELPPSRKCGPEDAAGVWKEVAVYESGSSKLLQEREKKGPKYLVFGNQYNRMVWMRTAKDIKKARLLRAVSKGKKQYIMTSAGMLYVYQGGKLADTLICSVSTQKTNKYEKGMLMLALPTEKDKPLTISLYAPLK